MFPEHFARDVGEDRQRGETTMAERRMRERKCGYISSLPSPSHLSFLIVRPRIRAALLVSASMHVFSFLSSSLQWEMITLSFLFLFLCSTAHFALKYEIRSFNFFSCPGILSFSLLKAFEIMLLLNPLLYSDQGSQIILRTTALSPV